MSVFLLPNFILSVNISAFFCLFSYFQPVLFFCFVLFLVCFVLFCLFVYLFIFLGGRAFNTGKPYTPTSPYSYVFVC